MPFTFSHPAIILPLNYLPKRWFSLTGLIIGSLTPDFEYFLRMKIQSNYSHTISGLFWFDLPIGILAAFLFHTIIRDSLFDNLPAFLKARLKKYTTFNWNRYFAKNWIVVIYSLLIGAGSHLLWDSFTHDHGYFVLKFEALRETIVVLGIELPILKILQHSSTLIGGCVILYALLKIEPEKNNYSLFNIRYWVLIMLLTFSITIIRFLSKTDQLTMGNLIVTIISAVLISLTLAPLIIRKTTK